MANTTTIGNITVTKSILDGSEFFPIDDAGQLKKSPISALTAAVDQALAEGKNLTYYFLGVN